MTRFIIFILTLLSYLALAGLVLAAPVHYTFEGTVIGIYSDDADIVAEAGIAVGYEVSYEFLIDVERDGVKNLNDGSIIIMEDNGWYDYFYVDLLSDKYLHEKNGGFYNEPLDTRQINYGYSAVRPYYQSVIYGGAEGDNIWINAFNHPFYNWKVGESFSGIERAYDSIGNYSRIDLSVVLTDISTVPIPGAVWLLGSGIIGLVSLRQKHNNRKFA